MVSDKNESVLSPDIVGQNQKDGQITYYSGISKKYHISEIFFLILTGVFVLCCLIFGYKELTYENIYYFAKDFDEVIKSDKYNTYVIEYGSGENRSYHCYHGGVIPAGKYSVPVYSATGRKTASFNTDYFHPAVITSKKYFLMYDMGGKSFSVYNSFMNLFIETLENPIYSATVSDSGELLVHTVSPQYRSVLYLYDHNFDRAAAYYFKDFVTCSSLSDDGKYIFAATAAAENAEYLSNFRIYYRGSKIPLSEYTIRGELPLGCGSFDKGCYLITDRSISIFDLNGKLISREKILTHQKFVTYASNEKGVCAVISDKNGYYLMCVPLRENAVLIELSSEPIALDIYDKAAYVLYNGAVARYDFTSGTYEIKECAPDASDILVLSDKKFYICYPTRAVYTEI